MVIYLNEYLLQKYTIREIRNYGTKVSKNKEILAKKSRTLGSRGHEYEFPIVRTERFKSAFINRCFFNFV